MAQQNGYAIIPHGTYDELRTYLLDTGVDVDQLHGNQCWDSCAILWYQYGLTLLTGNGYAYGCWTEERSHNAQPPFIAIENLSDVKRGDVVVFNQNGVYNTGHIGYADEDYPGGNHINILGQNQGQGSSHGTPSNIVNFSTTNFLGAFRNVDWYIPPEIKKKRKFPWVLYAKKLRTKRMGL